MWFKRVLLAYYATSVAVAVVTAANSKGAAVVKRHHQVESLIFLSLDRRQQPDGNQTITTKTFTPSSKDVPTSTVLAPSEQSQPLTSIAVSTTESLPESTISFSPSPTRSSSGPDLTSITTSGNNVETSTTSHRESESTTLFSPTLEQRPSESSSTVLSSLLHVTSSEIAISSTLLGITTFVSSSTEEVRTSSIIVAVTSSKSELATLSTSMSEPAPTTASLSLSVGSASTPAEGVSSTESDTAPTSTGGSMSKATSVEIGSSIVPPLRTWTFVSGTSSEVVSTTVLRPQPSTTVMTPIEQQPSPSISPSSEVLDTPISSLAVSTSSSRAPSPTPSSIATFFPTSGAMEAFPSAAPEWTTDIVTSLSELSTIVQTPTSSDMSSSVPVFSTFAPPATSSQSLAASTTEGPLPEAPPSTFLPTSVASSSLFSQRSSNMITESSTAANEISSGFSDRPISTTASVSAAFSAISSQINQVTTVSEMISLPSSSVVSQPELPFPTLTTGTQFSVAPIPAPMSQSTITQTPQSSNEVGSLITSSLEATLTMSVAPSSPTQAIPSSPTAAQPGSSVSSVSQNASSGSRITTEAPLASSWNGILSSTNVASEVTSLLLPSETISTSAASSVVSAPESSIDVPHSSASVATPSVILFPTQPTSSGLSLSTTFPEQSTLTPIAASESHNANSRSSSAPVSDPSSSLPSASSGSAPTSSSLSNVGQSTSSQSHTLFTSSSAPPSANATISTSETAGYSFTSDTSTSTYASIITTSSSRISSFVPSETSTSSSNDSMTLPLSIKTSSAQAIPTLPSTSGTVTATFSTIYISSARSSVVDLSTVAFSLFSSVTGIVVDSTQTRNYSAVTATMTSQGLGAHIPASETLLSSSRLELGANFTSITQVQSSAAAVGMTNSINDTRTGTIEFSHTFSRPSVPTGTLGAIPTSNATYVETLETSSTSAAINSTTVSLIASTQTNSVSGNQSNIASTTSTSTSDEASGTSGASGERQTSAIHHGPTSSPTQTASAGSPPPLTTSQTAGVAVGATTGLLIAVVAAVFIARRYHAARNGRRASTGSVYPKVAYLYDPKTGGDGGDAEALMSGSMGGPSGPASRAARGVSIHTQRHSTGTMPVARFTSPGSPFRETIRDPAVHRYSEYARVDTARALSAAVAGYGGTPDHTSCYTKYPSEVTNPFSDHVIPSPTFAPFSPDDIRRPEQKTPRNVDDGRGEYSRMAANSYAYLNTPASMYPPVSPYEQSWTPGPSLANAARRQTVDSDPFADPFEHDLLLHVDEQNRTSDSVTIFAPSPNLRTPRTPRTPVGPKLPVNQPNGMTSARSLLSPMAAKYLHKAHEVKIPRKSVASPVLVQVGRSPVIKPFSPPRAAPEPLGWDDIKRNSEKHFSDEQSVPAPLKFASPVIANKPAAASHTRTKPSLTGAGHTLLEGNGLPLTVKIPHRYGKSVGLDVPKMHGRPNPAHEELSSDPVVREKRSRELRFANPALIGKDF